MNYASMTDEHLGLIYEETIGYDPYAEGMNRSQVIVVLATYPGKIYDPCTTQ